MPLNFNRNVTLWRCLFLRVVLLIHYWVTGWVSPLFRHVRINIFQSLFQFGSFKCLNYDATFLTSRCYVLSLEVWFPEENQDIFPCSSLTCDFITCKFDLCCHWELKQSNVTERKFPHVLHQNSFPFRKFGYKSCSTLA